MQRTRLPGWPRIGRRLGFFLLMLWAGSAAQAHLMVAQRGTLNIVGDGAYIVFSLPVSAFQGVDDDGDGLLSAAEGNAHIHALEAQVRAGLQLLGPRGPLPLEGLMLTLTPPDDAPSAPSAQLVVVGRYALGESQDGLRLRQTLFGRTAAERSQEVTVTRGAERQRIVLAPGRGEQALMSSAWHVFLDHAAQGAEHVLGGLDHLLFLLVVLASAWGLRQTVLALSCFTVGHAISLAACVSGGLSVPAAVVEPAIAATIVGMAIFDVRARHRAVPWPASLRLLLVFACALIHGLGLAGALTGLGLDSGNRLVSLAGFNVGVEAGQLAVTLLAGGALALVQRSTGSAGVAMTTRLASFTAVAMGSIWLVQRVWVPG